MSRTLNIETLVENAFIENLSGFVTSGVAVKIWEDNKDVDLTPLVRVKATLTEELDGTMNLYCASSILVDFGVFTSKKRDLDGRTANEIRGDIRDLINQSDLDTLLNTTSGLFVYNNGIIPQESIDMDDKKLFQKGISVKVVATTI